MKLIMNRRRYDLMNGEHEYLRLLKDILDNGVKKEDRTGTGTISVFGRQIRHKMSEGYPLLTTKKMAFKTMITELLWFLKGDTNIKYLVDNGCNIWNGDAYKRYCDSHRTPGDPNGKTLAEQLDSVRPIEHSMESFIEQIKTNDEFAEKWGELGPIYGHQWRDWNGRKTDGFIEYESNGYSDHIKGIDQIQNLINDLKTNPDSRRLMVNAWNPADLRNQVLPPCHYGFQAYTRELSLNDRILEFANRDLDPSEFRKGGNYGTVIPEEKTLEVLNKHNIPTRAISLMFNMRSNDVPLGLPFNIASYGLLLEIFGKIVNMVPDELIANLGDAHIYTNQIDGVKEQLTREPYNLPKLDIHPGILDYELDKLEVGMFKLVDYKSHPSIKMPLSN